MALDFPSRGMRLPVVFGSVSPIIRGVHTPWSQLGALHSAADTVWNFSAQRVDACLYSPEPLQLGEG